LTRIFLIRHAEAEGNIFRRAHGHFNGQIIGRGYAQIERLKERFKNERIDAVYSSNLSRTCLTASAIYVPRRMQLSTVEMLREVKMGVWEDMPWGDIEHDYPEMNKLFNADPANWHVTGSEEFQHVQKRMKECISDIAGRHDGENVAIFSHGFAIRAFICGILGVLSSEIKKVPYFDNTAVTLLKYNGDQITIEYQGDNSHLSTEDSTFANQTWWRSKKERVFENLRIRPLDNERDCLILKSFHDDIGKEYNDSKVFTAILTNEAVGLIGLSSGKWKVESGKFISTEVDNESTGWIDFIYVRPELRHHNFGVQLLGQAVSTFRELRLEKLRIRLLKDNPEIVFFEKFEFNKIDDVAGFYILEKNIRNW